MTPIAQNALLGAFSCLGEACEDTCCQNWSMQVDAKTLAKYASEAPELLASVDMQTDGIPVMQRDATTRQCVKLEGGWCGIHKAKGDGFLGDACHFYPRVTRQIGGLHHMTAALSCPEITRLVLRMENPFLAEQANAPRLPSEIKNYAQTGMDDAQVLAVHRVFLDAAGDESMSAEHLLARVANVVRSMERLDKATWHQSIPLYLRLAGGSLPPAQTRLEDPFNLLHALCGLIVASHKPMSARLVKTISDVERALAVTLDWKQVQIHTSQASAQAYGEVAVYWQQHKAPFEPMLRRYLQAQMALNFFPFSGLGNDFAERITIIGVRFAMVKLALMCALKLQENLNEEDVVCIIQSLSRFQDHLGDGTYSLAIYEETGWKNEARMLGLLGL